MRINSMRRWPLPVSVVCSWHMKFVAQTRAPVLLSAGGRLAARPEKGVAAMKEKLEQIRTEALAALAGAKDAQELDGLRVKYLGKKGELTAVLKMMGSLSAEERPVMGQLANEVREALTEALVQRQKAIEEAALNQRLEDEKLDVTIPGKRPELGHKHPMSIALDELKEIDPYGWYVALKWMLSMV